MYSFRPYTQIHRSLTPPPGHSPNTLPSIQDSIYVYHVQMGPCDMGLSHIIHVKLVIVIQIRSMPLSLTLFDIIMPFESMDTLPLVVYR